MGPFHLINIDLLRRRCSALNLKHPAYSPLCIKNSGGLSTQSESEYLTHQLFALEIFRCNSNKEFGSQKTSEDLRYIEKCLKTKRTLVALESWLNIDSGLVLKNLIGVAAFAEYTLGINRLKFLRTIPLNRRLYLLDYLGTHLESLACQE
jgi:hypothetical protein